ncbi:Aldo/keto reductase [Rhizophagus irregularis]|uniref:Aldo/keto reductase n=1 Tax=Rhizophagus irregularis TaxID=588596 RepID=A0A2N1N683_9GLOM|nr:Aldo/keto reductase [Rhizophagus irregularis]
MRFAGANHTIRTLHPTTDIQISNRYQRCWQNINSSKTGVKISVIGMVCSSIGIDSADKQENIKVLNQAIDLGCTFWDSADIYDNGANEILFSKVLKDHHNELFLCTKFGIIRGPNGEFSVSDPNTTIEDTIGALAELVKEGKIKYISLSECSADTFQQAYKVHPIAAIQIECIPWTFDIEISGIVKGVTPGQLCLSWILAQGDNMIVIPGTRKIKHFEGNVEAVKVKLSSEELAEIRQIINSIEIIGNRYNDFL